jgi:hypothetical protein
MGRPIGPPLRWHGRPSATRWHERHLVCTSSRLRDSMIEADHRPSAKGLSVALELAAVIPLRGPVITPRPYVVRAAAGSSYFPSTTWPRCFSGASAPVRITFNPVTRSRWRGYGTALTRPGFSRLRHYRGCCFRSKSLVFPDAGTGRCFLHVGVSSVLWLPDVGRCVLLVGGRGHRRPSLSASRSRSPRYVSCHGGCALSAARSSRQWLLLRR